MTWPADQKRNPCAGFMGVHLLIGVQIPQHFSMIRGEDHYCVFFQPALFQCLKDASDIIVDP